MKSILLIFCLLPICVSAANFEIPNSISCISEESSLLGRHRKVETSKKSDEVKSRFSEWLFAENFSDGKSKLQLLWTPATDKAPEIKITTNDKPHNLLKIRSHTRDSLLFVTSASNPFSTESWTFALNFKVETLIATRVQSNIAGVKGEVITYNCEFDNLSSAVANSIIARS